MIRMSVCYACEFLYESKERERELDLDWKTHFLYLSGSANVTFYLGCVTLSLNSLAFSRY